MKHVMPNNRSSNKIFTRRWKGVLPFTFSILLAWGCGGQGAGTSSSLDPATKPAPTPEALSTALVTVDSLTREVTVVPEEGAGTRGVFTGGAVSVRTSELLDSPGSTGQKLIRMTLTNNQPQAIGVNGGLRVSFGGFTNLTATPTDISTLTDVKTIAGTGTAGSGDGPASGPVINDIGGICVANDAIYFTTKADGKLKKLANGQVSTIASGLLSPQGIAALSDTTTWVFVAETGRNRVVKIPVGGGAPVPVVGGGGGGAAGDVLAAGQDARFIAPTSLALTSYRINGGATAYRLYVADSGNSKVKVVEDPFGAPVATAFAATTGKPLHLTAGHIGVNQMIFATTNTHVVQATTDSEAPQPFVTVAGTGAAGNVEGAGTVARFSDPQGIVFWNGALFVSDKGNNRVRQMTLMTGGAPGSASSWRVARMAGTGPGTSLDAIGHLAVIGSPGALSVDGEGGLLLGDLHRLRRVTAPGLPYSIGADGGPASTAKVSLANPVGYTAPDRPYLLTSGSVGPGSLAQLPLMSFIIPDGVRLFQFTITIEGDTETPAVLDGKDLEGSRQVTLARTAGDGVPAFRDGVGLGARFAGISSLQALPSGVVYIVDRLNHAIRRMDRRGQVTTIIGGPTKGLMVTEGPGPSASLPNPQALWMNADETEGFAASANAIFRLQRVGPSPERMSDWTLKRVGGSVAGYVEGLGSTARFNGIRHIAATSDDELLISDMTNGRIRKMNLVGSDRGLPDSWNYSSLVTGLNKPCAFAVNLQGDAYIASEAGGVYLLTPNGASQVYAGLLGTFTHVDGVRQQARFGILSGLDVDKSGYIYVSESVTGRVRRISLNSERVTTVIAGGSSAGLEGRGNVASLGAGPTSISTMPDGDLVAADATSIWFARRVVGP
jgi:hypothetical protein